MAKTNLTTKRTVWFPGEKEWEQWFVADGRAGQLVKCAPGGGRDFALNARGGRVLALPVSSVVALPLLSNAPDKAGLIGTAQMHAERSGIGEDLESVGFEVLSGGPPNSFLRVEAPVSDRELWDGIVFPDHVFSSASLLPWVGDQVAIWRELGHLAVGFSKNGRLVYFDQLSSSNIGAECGIEIQRLIFQLNCQGVELMPEAITLWSAGGDAAGLQSAAGFPVKEEERPAPIARSLCEIAPRWLRDSQTKSSQRAVLRKRMSSVAAVAMVLIGALGAMIGVEAMKQKRLKNRIAELSPVASRIENMKAQWDEVAPAVDRDATPLEFLKAIQSTSGANAIQFSRVEISGDNIVIAGQSASPRSALQFLDEVTLSEALAEYGWEFEQPEISSSGAATFQIEGVK